MDPVKQSLESEIEELKRELDIIELEHEKKFLEVYSIKMRLRKLMNELFPNSLDLRIHRWLKTLPMIQKYMSDGIEPSTHHMGIRPIIVFSRLNIVKKVAGRFVTKLIPHGMEYADKMRMLEKEINKEECMNLASEWIHTEGDVPVLYVETEAKSCIRTGTSITLPSYKVLYGLMLLYNNCTQITICFSGQKCVMA